jgi:hypothetical protein
MTHTLTPDQRRDYIINRERILNTTLGEQILRLVATEVGERPDCVLTTQGGTQTIVDLGKVSDELIVQIDNMVRAEESRTKTMAS